MLAHLSYSQFAAIWCALVAAYVIFSIAGFGTALVPLMMAGSAIGAGVLLYTRPDVLMLMLGLFVVAYALYSLSFVIHQVLLHCL